MSESVYLKTLTVVKCDSSEMTSSFSELHLQNGLKYFIAFHDLVRVLLDLEVEQPIAQRGTQDSQKAP